MSIQNCLAGYINTCEKDGLKVPKLSLLSEIDAHKVSEDISPRTPVGECFVNMVSVDVPVYAKETF